jgi:hypothetical protein
MASAKDILVRIIGENQTDAAFNAVKSNVNSVSTSLKNNQEDFKKAAVAGTVAFAAITAEIYKAAQAFAESQKQMTIVDTILDGLGKDTLKQFAGGATEAKKTAREFGLALQNLGGISDEEASISFAKFLQITKDSTKAMEAARIAADLAKFKQIDYATASDVVTKVLAGNTSILTRYGIQIDANATAQEGLNAITAVAGGQYEAYGKTLAGQTDIMKQKFGDLQESIGQALMPALLKLIDALKPIIDQTMAWITAHPELTANLLLAAAAVAGLVAVVGALGVALPAVIAGFTILAGPVGIIAAIIAGIIFIIHNLIEIYHLLHDDGAVVWEGIKIMFKEKIDAIVGFFQPLISVIDAVIGRLQSMIDKAQAAAAAVRQTIASGPSGIISGAASEIKFLATGRAVGGVVNPGQPYIVGENGPEWFSPSNAGTIIPNGRMAAAGGSSISINISGNTLLDSNAGEKIASQIMKVLKNNLRI